MRNRNEEPWEVRKNLLMLVAYQAANFTMILGFFIVLYLVARSLGLL
jgi:hypothetical protein